MSHTVGEPLQRVLANRAQLVQQFALPAEPLWLTQVHGTRVWTPAMARTVGGPTYPEADAAVTAEPATVLSVLTADCLPVVIVSADGRYRGVAHAGWRGLVNGVLENTVAALTALGATHLEAWFGPCIGPASFEVGAEVLAQFVNHDARAQTCFSANARGRFLANLPALAAQRLARFGITVSQCGLDTLTDARCYSYRRQARTGRMATLVWAVAD
jgi:polyphenol oxidase